MVNSFLQLGADPALATGEWNAAKLARSMQHNTVANVLEMYQSEKAESLLQNYKFRYDEDTVNVVPLPLGQATKIININQLNQLNKLNQLNQLNLST